MWMRRLGVLAMATALSISTVPFAANAQTSGSAAATGTTASQNASPKAITDLMQAAQRLREATHALVREKDAQKRNQIISSIDKTLVDVQSAMVSLPPNLLLAGVKEKESKKAANKMARAADRLNAAADALDNANSPKAHDAVKDIRTASNRIRQERTQISANAGQSSTVGQPASK